MTEISPILLLLRNLYCISYHTRTRCRGESRGCNVCKVLTTYGQHYSVYTYFCLIFVSVFTFLEYNVELFHNARQG